MTQATHKIDHLDDINNAVLPQIALACALSRYGKRLVEIAGSISTCHSMDKPPSDCDLREAGDAAACAVLAVRDYHMAAKP